MSSSDTLVLLELSESLSSSSFNQFCTCALSEGLYDAGLLVILLSSVLGVWTGVWVQLTNSSVKSLS